MFTRLKWRYPSWKVNLDILAGMDGVHRFLKTEEDCRSWAKLFEGTLSVIENTEADVASITQVRFDRLRDWMKRRGVYPGADSSRPSRTSNLAFGSYSEFEDFPNLVRLIEAVRLGKGEKARRYLGIEGVRTGVLAKAAI